MSLFISVWQNNGVLTVLHALAIAMLLKPCQSGIGYVTEFLLSTSLAQKQTDKKRDKLQTVVLRSRRR